MSTMEPMEAVELLPSVSLAELNAEAALLTRVDRVTPIRVDLVDDTTTVEVHYALAPRPTMPRAERHDVPAVTR